MASTNSTNSTDPLPSPDDIAAKALTKRFDALITVRTKAIKGKGACTRLRPGSVPSPLPISMVNTGSNHSNNSRKRASPASSVPYQNHALAMVNSALELLSDWLYETCGSVSLATIEHRKFQAFLSQVGLPATNTLRREISGPRLDAKFSEAKAESEAKIRDAMFFQVASDGWKNMNWYSLCCSGENLVKFVVNLPNGTSVFQKALFTGGVVSSSYAEEVLWETVIGASGSVVQRCVGIVADKFKAKALRNLEAQNHWMVNTSCQLQGFISLINDFNNEGFWNELEAVYSIVKVIRGMIQDIEAERLLIGRCLPLWEELRTKVKEWYSKYNIAEGPVEKLMCPGQNDVVLC
ncbi:hypothetical protein Ahy_A09g042328 [Arachis hypogaea]|uniref:DUF659 domain-containing protein n=1 Tax=Arachis hypogaea TaxID=3818 RepID=A0A445BFN3_ARAHY|nr:hypothetical protein Ahy_A09g042328 [Arachis hypogaea]